jgi:hypothetical protein
VSAASTWPLFSPLLEAEWQKRTLARALRDIADGHLMVLRGADGIDRADRLLAGAPAQWWKILEARELYLPPAVSGAWTLQSPSN